MRIFCSGLAVAAGVALALGIAGPSASAVVNVSQTLDLTKPQQRTSVSRLYVGSPEFASDFNVAIAEGDVLDFRIDFLGNQQVTINEFVFMYLGMSAAIGSPATHFQETGRISFFDSAGATVFTTDPYYQAGDSSDNINHSATRGYIPTNITFAGLRLLSNLQEYDRPGVTTRNYSTPFLYLQGSIITVSEFAAPAPAPAPEPGSWALMILGFGAVGAVMRRRTPTATAQ